MLADGLSGTVGGETVELSVVWAGSLTGAVDVVTAGGVAVGVVDGVAVGVVAGVAVGGVAAAGGLALVGGLVAPAKRV